LISSHRWLGANTAAPLFYGQIEQVEATERFLSSNVLAVDIFAVTNEADGARIAPLSHQSEDCLTLKPG
jgi:hypothetical protein